MAIRLIYERVPYKTLSLIIVSHFSLVCYYRVMEMNKGDDHKIQILNQFLKFDTLIKKN